MHSISPTEKRPSFVTSADKNKNKIIEMFLIQKNRPSKHETNHFFSLLGVSKGHLQFLVNHGSYKVLFHKPKDGICLPGK